MGTTIEKTLAKINTPERRKQEDDLAKPYPTNIIIPLVYGTRKEIDAIGLVDALWENAQALADTNGDGKIEQSELLAYIERDERISGFINRGEITLDPKKELPTITRDDYQAFIDGALKNSTIRNLASRNGEEAKVGILDGNRNGILDKGDVALNVADLTGCVGDLHGGLGALDPLLVSYCKQEPAKAEPSR